MITMDRLEPQDWMAAPETLRVVAALAADGAEVRFVGGCVRDALAGRPVKDIDLATPDPPDRVMELLRRARVKAVPTGIAHGTVTAVVSHRPFEVTTLRRDVETHGRHATVAFTDDWEADAARRDFTFNAMSCRADGTLFDPFDGRADLAAGRVRFVGDARARIEEDYLRLLRFFRFQAYYGRGEPDPEGLAAAAELAPHLRKLSGERIREEILRILGALGPVPVLEIMRDKKILATVLPEIVDTAALKALINLGIGTAEADPLLRLGVLIVGGREAAAAVAERLRLSKAQNTRLTDMAEIVDSPALDADDPALDADERSVRQAIYRQGRHPVADRLRLAWARRAAAGQEVDRPAAVRNLALADNWVPPGFPLKGRDALDRGAEQGAALGNLLGEVEAWWIAEDFVPDRQACLRRLESLLAPRT